MAPRVGNRAIVIGASSGIGAALALELAREGYDIAAVARREALLAELAARAKREGLPGSIRAYAHDVRDTKAVPALFERIAGDLHGLELVVYASGVLPAAGPEEWDAAEDRDVVEVNLVGAIAWLDEAARRFAVARAGTIVGISSMAGERGRRRFPSYSAAKAGLNAYLEAVRNRLSVRGVRVITVKPGFVQTSMLDGRSGTFWVISAEEAARQIARAIRRGREHVFVSPRWRLVSWALRLMPSPIFRRLPI